MHQKILDWAVALLAFVIALISLVGLLLFAWHAEDATPWVKMSAAEWGVWVGSIGTIGALLGTIWLATTDSRSKRREALTSAQLHGASMAWRLVYLYAGTSTASEILSGANKSNIVAKRDIVATTLGDMAFWPISELLPLIPLQGDAASKIALAADQVGLAKALLQRTRSMNPDEILRFTPDAVDMLKSAAKLLKEATTICQAAAMALHVSASLSPP